MFWREKNLECHDFVTDFFDTLTTLFLILNLAQSQGNFIYSKITDMITV